jgi:hypothetical protein
LIEASWQALVDSVEYKLHKDNVKPRVTPPLKRNGTRPARKAGEGNARPAAPTA